MNKYEISFLDGTTQSVLANNLWTDKNGGMCYNFTKRSPAGSYTHLTVPLASVKFIRMVEETSSNDQPPWEV